MLAAAVFDADGNAIQVVPSTQLLPELEPEDYPRLLGGEQISRYYPDFPLDQYLAHVSGPADQRRIPVAGSAAAPARHRSEQEVSDSSNTTSTPATSQIELAVIEGQLDRKTAMTLGIGAALVARHPCDRVLPGL